MTFIISEGSATVAQCDFSWTIRHCVRSRHQHPTESGTNTPSDPEKLHSQEWSPPTQWNRSYRNFILPVSKVANIRYLC